MDKFVLYRILEFTDATLPKIHLLLFVNCTLTGFILLKISSIECMYSSCRAISHRALKPIATGNMDRTHQPETNVLFDDPCFNSTIEIYHSTASCKR